MGVQAALSLMLVGTCCFLWATAQVVPTELFGLTGIVVAFWVGNKSAQQAFDAASPAPKPVFIPGEANDR
jgi:hypothetical protein